MSALDRVEAGLAEFVDYQRQLHGRVKTRRFTRKALANCIRRATGHYCSVEEASNLLQTYRLAQEMHTAHLDWHVVCRGYARAARWYIIAGPGLPTLTGETMLVAHLQWVVRDASSRLGADFRRELNPGRLHHPILDKKIELFEDQVRQAADGLIAQAQADAELWEAATGRVPTVIEVETTAETALLAELETA